MFSLIHYNEACETSLVKRLEGSYGKEIFKPGLDRVLAFLKDYPLTKVKIITIAGTNGKGETARTLTSLLEKEGQNVAMWTSPHLVSVTERFYGEKKLISYQELNKILDEIEKWQNKNNIFLSYYELLFCAFLLWIKSLSLDFLVLEVGLGGRLDAVNALSCDYALITSIARDHQEFLGKKYKEILKEKFGICRKKTTLFTSFQLDYLNLKLNDLVLELENEWQRISLPKETDFSTHNKFFSKIVASKILDKKIDDDFLKNFRSHPIIGEHELAGRKYQLYGSHNPESLRKLVHFLSSSPYNNQSAYDLILFSLSRRDLKDISTVVELISRIPAKRTIFVPMQHHKAQPLGEIISILEKNGFEIRDQIEDQFFNEIPKGAKVLGTGSNYFIGNLYSRIFLR